MKKKVMLFLAVSMILTMSPGVSAKENIFTIATSAGMEPFEYKEDETVVGIDIQIGEFLAEDLDADLKIENMTFQEVIESVKQGRIKVGISAIPITEGEQEEFEFSDSYYTGKLKVLTERDSSITSISELENKAVGMITNYTELEKEADRNCEIVYYNSVKEELQALDQRKIDGMIIDEMAAKVLIDQREDLKVLEEDWSEVSYGVIVEKEDEDMLLEVNELLSLMQESGELQKVFEKYIGTEETLEETEN